MKSLPVEAVEFPDGSRAPMVKVSQGTPIEDVLEALELSWRTAAQEARKEAHG